MCQLIIVIFLNVGPPKESIFLRLDSNIESKSSNNTYLKSFKHHPNNIFIIIFFSVYYIANNVYVTMPQAGFEPTEARVATYLNMVVRSTSKPPRLGISQKFIVPTFWTIFKRPQRHFISKKEWTKKKEIHFKILMQYHSHPSCNNSNINKI